MSNPIPIEISSTSILVFSHRFAISLINVIFVARKALDAYLINSEALLFVGLPNGQPLSSEKVASLMRGVRSTEIDEFARDLAQHYETNGCPYEIVSEGSGWILRLRKEFRQYGAILEAKTRRVRLDAAALDALAVVAWNQPVARDDLARLGCDATPAIMRQLVRRGLLELVKLPCESGNGEEEIPCYRTTSRFLEVFQLHSLSDLPDPHEPPR